MKKSMIIRTLIDKDIKVNDRVRVIDGSSLTYLGKEYLPNKAEYGDNPKECVIVESYPLLTGSTDKLKDIIADVIEISIKNRCTIPSFGLDVGYLQDIVVKIGNGYFRTSSKLTRKL